MNKRIKKKWVAELRSGKYTQIQEKLKDPRNGRCCLGVLCELYLEEHPEDKAPKGKHKFYNVSEESYACDSFALPNDKVYKWAGFSANRVLVSKERIGAAQVYNDSGFSFEEIAQMIEEQW